MLFYANETALCLQSLVKRLPWDDKPGCRHQNTYVSDFGEKLEHFVYFRPGICAFLAIIMLIYAN